MKSTLAAGIVHRCKELATRTARLTWFKPILFTVLAAAVIGAGRQQGNILHNVTMVEQGTAQANREILTTFNFQPPTTAGSTGTSGATTGQAMVSGTSTGGFGNNNLTGTTTGTTATTGTTGTGYTNWYFFVADQGTGYNTNWNLGIKDGNSNNQSLVAVLPSGPAVNGVDAPTVNAHGYNVNTNGDYVQPYDTASVSGDQMTTWVVETLSGFNQNHQPTMTYTYWRTDYKLVKVPFFAISVDSRMINGQPDLDGELPGDANADPKNANFNNWFYDGGLFFGNAAWITGDQSGTARLQLSATAPTLANPACSTSSIVYLGSPSAFNTAVTMQISAPETNDPYLNQNQATVTWATKWTPGASIGTVNFTTGMTAPQYISMPCTVSHTGQILDEILAIQNESQFVQNGSSTWQYFCSPTYAAQFAPAWPYDNAQARAWVLDQVYTNSWTVTDLQG